MTTTLRVLSIGLAVSLAGFWRPCYADPASRETKGQLTVTGRVLMPDGSPAAGAIVSSLESKSVGANTTKAGSDGKFQLSGQFWFDCRLHARSADETHQTTLFIPAIVARTRLAKPVELKLTPPANMSFPCALVTIR